jgi:23S rRNA pseudouridine1911/1915/1917 synthase
MSPPPTSARVAKDNLTLQDFIASWMSLSRNRAKSLIDARTVFVNSTRIWMARHRLKRGDIVEISGVPPPARRSQAPEILLDTPSFLVVNKPADCLANGPASAEQELRDFLKDPQIQASHRLDRDTTGCLLMARNQAAFDAVLSCFRDRRVVKIYHALVAGSIDENERCIEAPIDGESAVTHLRVLDRNRSASHLSLRIDTGRTHQIRRHLEQIGHPVLGDKQYGVTALLAPGLRSVERQMLHAYSIRFTSPLDNQLVKAEAPLPRDFKAWMNRLRLD